MSSTLFTKRRSCFFWIDSYLQRRKVYIFLSPQDTNWNEAFGSYGDYAVDKTFGVTDPKFNLVKGFGYALPHTKRTPIQTPI